MSIAEKLTTIAENEQRVFEAGKNDVLSRSNETEITTSGKVVSIYDGSPLHNVTVRLTSDTITDFTGIKVTKYSKNVTPPTFYDGITKVQNGVTWVNNKDGTVYVNGTTPSGVVSFFLLDHQSVPYLAEGKEYILRNNGNNVLFLQTVTTIDGKGSNVGVFNEEARFTVDRNAFVYGNIFLQVNGNKTADETVTPLLIEVESETEVLTANADGTINGFTPEECMTFVADNKDVNISVTYRKSFGSKSEYDNFWDTYQWYGNRTDYMGGFFGRGWNDKTYKPKYPIKIKGDASQTYRNCSISAIKDIDTSEVTSFSQFIFNNGYIETVDKLDFSSATYTYNAIAHCSKLHTIGEIVSSATTVWHTGTFYTLAALKHLTITGIIATAFTCTITTIDHDSIVSIVNALSPTTSGLTATISQTAVINAFGSTDSAEWLSLRATKPNWTISLA